SVPTDLAAAGATILFNESGEGGGPGYSAYVRKTDGSPAVRLGQGGGRSLSPDGKTALGILPPSGEPLLYPTGAGEPQRLGTQPLVAQNGSQWCPDGKH